MRTAILGVVLLAALAIAGPAQGADAVDGQLIVGFDRGTNSQRATERVADAGGSVQRRLDRIDALVARPRAGTSVSQLRERLRRLRLVRYVEPDFILEKSATPDDPLYAQQYALGSGSGGISAPPAWDQRTKCSLVAALDSGTQYDHPDLKDNVWHNSHEKKNNGKDDDRNGYVDDYYGADVTDGSGSGGDENGHGTHVAGIVAGRGDNGAGIAGACWSGKLMPIRFMDSRGRGSTSDAVAGLEYAVHEGAKIVNCSFGSTSKSSALQDAVKHAQNKGVLLVVAAGNDGDSIESHPVYPASFTNGNILTVAATTQRDALASFSNYGSKSVDLGAPGDNIQSTYPKSKYKSLDGTSMAAPLVAAAAAMLRAADSDLSYSDLRSALKATVDPLPGLAGKTVTGGRINLERALARVS